MIGESPNTLVLDDGFTLVELLVTIVIGMIILAAALGLMTSGFASSASVQDRVDAAALGRRTLDRVGVLLGAQVCNGTQSPIIDATPTSVTFTASTGRPGDPPVRYQVRFNSATGVLEEIRTPLALRPASDPAVYDPSGSPTTVQIMDKVEPSSQASPAPPIFTYWGTDNATTADPVQLGAGAASLTAAQAARILRVDIDLRVLPSRLNDVVQARKVSTRLQTSAVVTSNLDPKQLNKGPQCTGI